MTFFFNGLTGTNVTLSGSIALPVATSTQTVKTFQGSGSINNGNVDIYTVTVGKTFYLTGIIWFATTVATSLNLTVLDNGTAVFRGKYIASNTVFTFNSSTPIPITTKLQINHGEAGAVDLGYCLVGFEQ